jgi:hypothetical protein
MVADTIFEGADLATFARSAWTQPATVVEGTTGEGHPLASDRLVGVGSASNCGGGNDCLRQSSGLFSFVVVVSGWLSPSRPNEQRPEALASVPRSAWAQPGTELGVTTGEDDALASERYIGVG